MSAALLALAERCEAATGPDRELDALIWWHSGEGPKAEPHYAHLRDVVALGRIFGRNPAVSEDDLAIADVGYRAAREDVALRYTASLDAAMTLVPEGMILRQYMATRYVPHGCEVAVDWAHGGWDGHSDHSFALALCAAALRARAAQ